MERVGFNWYTCRVFQLVHLLWRGWFLLYIYIYMLWFLISTPVVERVLIGTHVKRMAFNWYTFCGEAVFQLVHLLWRGWFFIGTPFLFLSCYTCCGKGVL